MSEPEVWNFPPLLVSRQLTAPQFFGHRHRRHRHRHLVSRPLITPQFFCHRRHRCRHRHLVSRQLTTPQFFGHRHRCHCHRHHNSQMKRNPICELNLSASIFSHTVPVVHIVEWEMCANCNHTVPLCTSLTTITQLCTLLN